MDIGSVFKADRDLVERSVAPQANDLKRSLDANNAAAASSSAAVNSAVPSVAPEVASSERVSVRDKRIADPSRALQDPVWEQDSFVSQATIRNSFISEESALAQELRTESERERALSQEERQQEAREHAKEVIAALNQKRLAIRFDTSEKFEDANVVNIVDSETSEVLRQIPSEEILRVRAAVQAYEQRLAHDDMVADPALKARGVDTAGVNEDLRGVVIDFEA